MVHKNLSNTKIKKRVKEIIFATLRFLFLTGIGFIVLYPMLIMFSCIFSDPSSVNDATVVWLPKGFSWFYVDYAVKILEIKDALISTMVITVGSVIIQVIVCSIIGYGFARFDFRGKKILFALVILTIIVPPQTIILPLYMNYRFFDVFGIFKLLEPLTGFSSVNLIDSPLTFYLPSLFGVGLKAGLFIFIFRQFYLGMPKELEEAAKVDGCGAWRTYLKIMVPNASPAFLTVGIFSVVWHWNDVLLSNMFLNRNATLAARLSQAPATLSASSMYGTVTMEERRIVIFAGCVIFLLPILIGYIFVQKYFIQSIERSGIVG